MERKLRDKLPGGQFKDVAAGDVRRMSAVRGKGNKSTEARLRAHLVRAGVRGWRLHNKSIAGNPDFYFPDAKVAVFSEGCFWHGCPTCGHIPSKNRAFWAAKISRNQERDRQNEARLQELGVHVLRVWEHELKGDPAAWLQRLRELIGDGQGAETTPAR